MPGNHRCRSSYGAAAASPGRSGWPPSDAWWRTALQRSRRRGERYGACLAWSCWGCTVSRWLWPGPNGRPNRQSCNGEACRRMGGILLSVFFHPTAEFFQGWWPDPHFREVGWGQNGYLRRRKMNRDNSKNMHRTIWWKLLRNEDNFSFWRKLGFLRGNVSNCCPLLGYLLMLVAMTYQAELFIMVSRASTQPFYVYHGNVPALLVLIHASWKLAGCIQYF